MGLPQELQRWETHREEEEEWRSCAEAEAGASTANPVTMINRVINFFMMLGVVSV